MFSISRVARYNETNKKTSNRGHWSNHHQKVLARCLLLLYIKVITTQVALLREDFTWSKSRSIRNEKYLSKSLVIENTTWVVYLSRTTSLLTTFVHTKVKLLGGMQMQTILKLLEGIQPSYWRDRSPHPPWVSAPLWTVAYRILPQYFTAGIFSLPDRYRGNFTKTYRIPLPR